MHRLLSELAGEGLAILMISSELPEVLGMADRVLVVCEGRITADIPRDEATPENVMHAATRPLEARSDEPSDPPEPRSTTERAHSRAEQPCPLHPDRSTPWSARARCRSCSCCCS